MQELSVNGSASGYVEIVWC